MDANPVPVGTAAWPGADCKAAKVQGFLPALFPGPWALIATLPLPKMVLRNPYLYHVLGSGKKEVDQVLVFWGPLITIGDHQKLRDVHAR